MDFRFHGYDITIEYPPIGLHQIDQLTSFWQAIFDCSFEWIRPVLAGAEQEHNRDVLFLMANEGKLAATCRLTVSRSDGRVGLVGDVAVDPEFRGKGLARQVCSTAISEFRENGGEALFLATSNPAAEYLYSSLGWHKIPGSNVMLNPVQGAYADEWILDYYRLGEDLPVKIVAGEPKHRALIVPLIVTPHDADLLDANAHIRSVRYARQPSCEGLYAKYAGLEAGAWFAAERSDGAVVGIASAVVYTDTSCCVDAFTHARYGLHLNDLIQSAVDWAQTNGASSTYTICPQHDVYKRHNLNSLNSIEFCEIRTDLPDWFIQEK